MPERYKQFTKDCWLNTLLQDCSLSDALLELLLLSTCTLGCRSHQQWDLRLCPWSCLHLSYSEYCDTNALSFSGNSMKCSSKTALSLCSFTSFTFTLGSLRQCSISSFTPLPTLALRYASLHCFSMFWRWWSLFSGRTSTNIGLSSTY